MAGKRIEIAHSPYDSIPTQDFQTDAAATIIEAGMLLKRTSAGSPYVTPCVTGDFTIATDTNIVGLAAKDSTHTATADGKVEVYAPLQGITYRAYATTAANIDTEAKLLAIEGDRVDLTVSATTSAGDWSINEDNGDTPALAFQVRGGNYSKGTVEFLIRDAATEYGDDKIT